MTKPIVLLVHGMGTHPPGNITTEFTKGVNQAGAYLGVDDLDIGNKIDFKEYNYSEKLDAIRQAAAEYHGGIKDYLQFISGGTLGNIAAKLSAAEAKFGTDSFIYTHWLDVAYYGLTYHNEEMRLELAQEFTTLRRDCEENDRKLHVVGHSLGTALVHDTLAKLYREDVGPDDQGYLSSESLRFESLWMIANVSRLLHILTRAADPNHSIVHDSTEEAAGCAKYFYNVRNKFDPFLFIKEYKREIEYGEHIQFSEVRKLENNDLIVNPHDLTEYMACPDVSIAFLYATLGMEFTREQENAAIAAYRADSIQGATEEAYNAIKSFIDTLGDTNANNLDTLIKAYETAKKAIDDLRALAD